MNRDGREEDVPEDAACGVLRHERNLRFREPSEDVDELGFCVRGKGLSEYVADGGQITRRLCPDSYFAKLQVFTPLAARRIGVQLGVTAPPSPAELPLLLPKWYHESITARCAASALAPCWAAALPTASVMSGLGSLVDFEYAPCDL